MFNQRLLKYTETVIADPSRSLSYEEACEIADLPIHETVDLIMCACKIKKHCKPGPAVTCSIINAKSGMCSQNCAFCAQSAHNRTNVPIYPLLDHARLVDTAIAMHAAGAKRYSFVTSGYRLKKEEIESIAKAADTIRAKTDLTLCASLGMLDQATGERLRESGITYYHHNLETARSYFEQVCTTHDYEEDIETIRVAKACGLKVCSGGILGLGESWRQRIELAFTLKELDVDGIPLNFLNPIAGTGMEKRPLLSPLEALKCIALFRFINPARDIIVCGGREVTLKDYQSWLLAAGANGLIIGNYLTTQGRNTQMDIDMIEEAI